MEACSTHRSTLQRIAQEDQNDDSEEVVDDLWSRALKDPLSNAILQGRMDTQAASQVASQIVDQMIAARQGDALLFKMDKPILSLIRSVLEDSLAPVRA